MEHLVIFFHHRSFLTRCICTANHSEV